MYNPSEKTFLNCCQTIYFPQKVKRTFVKTKCSAQFFVIFAEIYSFFIFKVVMFHNSSLQPQEE